MKISGRVYCLFEESGVFKNAFRAAGIEAFDFDIKNEYGETDSCIDLFAEIDKAYMHDTSLFDGITHDDFVIAFFPCIYFCEVNQMYFNATTVNYRSLTDIQKVAKVIARSRARQRYYELLLKLFFIALDRSFRLVVENPFSFNSFLYNNFPFAPAVVDYDRTQRGDKFKKPTQYFFLNCVPTRLQTVEKKYKTKKIYSLSGSHIGGICNKERSEITPEYARNFINDFILGNITEKTEKNLFNN